ncbi:hypothetical protein D3C81_1633430 [compost metagenome]
MQAQGSQHAATAIVGSTAADCQNNALCPCAERGVDQLASAPGAAAAGITLRTRHQLDTTGLGHLDDRRTAVGQPAPTGLHRLAQWPANGLPAQLAVAGSDNRLHGAFAAIGHGALEQLSARQRLGQAGGDGTGDTGSIKAVFERVGGDDDLHGDSPVQMAAC